MSQDVELFLSVAERLRSEMVELVDPWEGSPFAWMKSLPSRTRGRVGEELVAGWLSARGLVVERPPSSEADLLVEGVPVEVKLSMLWASGVLCFQQIRRQRYRLALLLGLAPFDVAFWSVPRDVLWRHATPQHGGRRGTDTRWLRFPADVPPAWLARYGGTLRQGAEVLRRQLTGGG